MANSKIYTRAYSESSAGQLVCGRGLRGGALSHQVLLNEFQRHAKRYNQKPTALVSVSDRIIDTVKRAFDKHYTDGESPADIWVVFIEVPATTHETPARVHPARLLAEQCGFPNPNSFYHEMVFEWAIPEKYVLHKVSLQTLNDRSIEWDGLTRSGLGLQPLSTKKVRSRITNDLQPTGCWNDDWDIGVYLGCFARNFGARAPLKWISHQLFYDCVGKRTFEDVDDGIENALIDWWLTDDDFLRDYEKFKEFRDEMENSMAWDHIDYWETWHDVNCGDTIRYNSEKENFLHDKMRNELSAKHEEIRTAIEERAVMIGL